MKLYYAPGACSLAVHIALLEIGADVETVRVDLATHRLADGRDYLAISPRGYVPLLELEDGSRHTEAAALLMHVAELQPSVALIGAPGSARRQQVIEWLVFVGTELHQTCGPLWSPETPDATRSAATRRLALRFAELDRHFASHAHLAGDYSVADAYAFTILGWAGRLGLTLAPYPQLQAYLPRIAARPAVQAALRDEGLLK